jgi:hypothetical protein
MPADRTPPRRALDADGQLVTHPYQGSARVPVYPGSQLRPGKRRTAGDRRLSRVPWNFGGGPRVIGGILLGRCDIGGDCLIECHPQGRQVQVPVDAAEWLGCLAHPDGDPAQHHLAVLPALDVGGVVAADLDHRLEGVGAAQRSGQGGRHAKPTDREGLGQAFPQGRGRAGVGAVQRAGQCFQVGLGDQRVGGAVGDPHPLGHGRGDGIG